MNKIIKILLIIILLAIIASLIAVMVFFMKNDFKFWNMKLADSYEVEASLIDQIHLTLDSADVEIKESNTDKILVEYYSNSDSKVKIENKDKSILIDETKNKERVYFGFNNKKVVIYVPVIYVGEYEIKTQSGDIRAEVDLSNNKVTISSSSGDVSLNATGDIDVSTSSGDIKVNKINEKADISSSSGDISIDKLDIKENSKITTSSGDVSVHNNQGDCYVETETSSGDTRINKSDRKSDIVLKIKTSSGDIQVD